MSLRSSLMLVKIARAPLNFSLLLSGPHVRLAPLYDVASILPYDEIDLKKAKFAMKVGSEYKLSQIGLRQWQKFAREVCIDADEMIELLASMAKQLPDEVNAARLRARKECLTNAIVERLATQLIARADDCRRLLGAE
jgi:serine/threonine-protein kinase HipA